MLRFSIQPDGGQPILDFSKWKTKVFEPQFQKLHRSLKIWYAPKK